MGTSAPMFKINAAPNTPKIQIQPQQPVQFKIQVPQMNVQLANSGIKRKREDDDYDQQ